MEFNFFLIQKDINIKSPSYLINIVKHLLALSMGEVPGFAPAIDDNAGPISEIQRIYSDIYGLEYSPIIMQPTFFDIMKDRSVYFSFEYPNTIELSNKSREDSSKLNDLIFSQSLLKKYISNLKANKYNLGQTPIYDNIENIGFDFYHTDAEDYASIKSSDLLYNEDTSFGINVSNSNKFPSNSSFLRGCVRVYKK